MIPHETAVEVPLYEMQYDSRPNKFILIIIVVGADSGLEAALFSLDSADLEARPISGQSHACRGIISKFW